MGLVLQEKGFLHHVTNDHPFGDGGYYFRLQPFHVPKVLNSFCTWHDRRRSDDGPMYVVHRLGALWSKLESKHLNGEGLVDHSTIRDDDLYWKFEEEVCELQTILLDDMEDPTKFAFVINLYNLMIKYAFVKVGIATTTSGRSSFFDDVCVALGSGETFSFNELEHGILRANTLHPYKMSKEFGSSDPRARLALRELDPRLHLALNCGARSCPPVKRYTAEAIDEELRLAATAFCENDENVLIDEEGLRVRLSKIFHWYMSDFGE